MTIKVYNPAAFNGTVYSRQLIAEIDTTRPNRFLPGGIWTDDNIDIVCQQWTQGGFDVILSGSIQAEV